MHLISDPITPAPAEMWIRSEGAAVQEKRWACMRLLSEVEIVDLLCDRTGHSRAAVRRMLASYDRSAVAV